MADFEINSDWLFKQWYNPFMTSFKISRLELKKLFGTMSMHFSKILIPYNIKYRYILKNNLILN